MCHPKKPDPVAVKALYDREIKTTPPQYQHLQEDYTCNKCPNVLECIYAFDPYNTGGDCLMDK